MKNVRRFSCHLVFSSPVPRLLDPTKDEAATDYAATAFMTKDEMTKDAVRLAKDKATKDYR